MQTQALAPGQICMNGRFYTLDVHNTITQSVAVKGGQFLTISLLLFERAPASLQFGFAKVA